MHLTLQKDNWFIGQSENFDLSRAKLNGELRSEVEEERLGFFKVTIHLANNDVCAI
jgi:hypothetical protein